MHLTSQRVALAVLLAASAGCSSELDGRVEGPLLTSVGGSGDGMAAIVQGQLGYKRECLLLDGMPIIWPVGTKWDSVRRSLQAPNGDVVEAGASLTGGGGYMDLQAVRDIFGQQVADAAKQCLGQTGEIAVFNPGSDVSLAE
ncbi:hypothetical protein BH20GEM2_BH20GEM2_11420 [soil metagenome]